MNTLLNQRENYQMKNIAKMTLLCPNSTTPHFVFKQNMSYQLSGVKILVNTLAVGSEKLTFPNALY